MKFGGGGSNGDLMALFYKMFFIALSEERTLYFNFYFNHKSNTLQKTNMWSPYFVIEKLKVKKEQLNLYFSHILYEDHNNNNYHPKLL